MTPEVLYHYTCRDGFAAIERSDWWLKPNDRAALPLVWMTDLATPDRQALGLTSHSLTCDRTEFRLVIRDALVIPWWRYARREKLPRDVRDVLEMAPGAQPMRWWVSAEPVRCAK